MRVEAKGTEEDSLHFQCELEHLQSVAHGIVSRMSPVQWLSVATRPAQDV